MEMTWKCMMKTRMKIVNVNTVTGADTNMIVSITMSTRAVIG